MCSGSLKDKKVLEANGWDGIYTYKIKQEMEDGTPIVNNYEIKNTLREKYKIIDGRVFDIERMIREKECETKPLYVGSITYATKEYYDKLFEVAKKIHDELEKNPEYKEQAYKYMAEQDDLPEDIKKKYQDCLDEIKKENEGWVVEDKSAPDQLELYWSEQITKLKRLGTKEALEEIERINKDKENFEKHRQEVMKKTLELNNYPPVGLE